jgi:hypothetical protein
MNWSIRKGYSRSTIKSYIIAGILIFAAFSVLSIINPASTGRYGTIPLAGFGLAVVLRTFPKLNNRTDILILDKNGITDTRLPIRRIEWSDIERADFWSDNDRASSTAVRIRLKNPAAYLSELSFWGRFHTCPFYFIRKTHVSIGTMILDISPEALKKVIDQMKGPNVIVNPSAVKEPSALSMFARKWIYGKSDVESRYWFILVLAIYVVTVFFDLFKESTKAIVTWAAAIVSIGQGVLIGRLSYILPSVERRRELWDTLIHFHSLPYRVVLVWGGLPVMLFLNWYLILRSPLVIYPVLFRYVALSTVLIAVRTYLQTRKG